MSIGQRLKEYRKYDLDIKSNEAAYRLGITPTAYSNYEQGSRSIPVDLLPVIKEKFCMSDEDFLFFILGVKNTETQKSPNELAHAIQDVRERYMATFSSDYYPFIAATADLRELISLLAKLDKKKLISVLNALRGLVQVHTDLLTKIEKLEAKNRDD